MHDLIPLISQVEKKKLTKDIHLTTSPINSNPQTSSNKKAFIYDIVYPYTERCLTPEKLFDLRHTLHNGLKKKCLFNEKTTLFETFLMKSLPILFEIRKYDDIMETFDSSDHFLKIKKYIIDIIIIYVNGLYPHIIKRNDQWKKFSKFIKFNDILNDKKNSEDLKNALFKLFKKMDKLLRLIIQHHICYSVSKNIVWVNRIKRFIDKLFSERKNKQPISKNKKNKKKTAENEKKTTDQKKIKSENKNTSKRCLISISIRNCINKLKQITLFILDVIIQGKLKNKKVVSKKNNKIYDDLEKNGKNNSKVFCKNFIWFFNVIDIKTIQKNIKIVSTADEKYFTKKTHSILYKFYDKNPLKVNKFSNDIQSENKLRIYNLPFIDFIIMTINNIKSINYKKELLNKITNEICQNFNLFKKNSNYKLDTWNQPIHKINDFDNGYCKNVLDILNQYIKLFKLPTNVLEIFETAHKCYKEKSSARYVEKCIESYANKKIENLKALIVLKIILIMEKKKKIIKKIPNKRPAFEKLRLIVSILKRSKLFVNPFCLIDSSDVLNNKDKTLPSNNPSYKVDSPLSKYFVSSDKENFKKMTSIYIANCCQRVVSLIGNDNCGLINTSHNKPLNEIMKLLKDGKVITHQDLMCNNKNYRDKCKKRTVNKKNSIFVNDNLSIDSIQKSINSSLVKKKKKKNYLPLSKLSTNKIYHSQLFETETNVKKTKKGKVINKKLESLIKNCGMLFENKINVINALNYNIFLNNPISTSTTTSNVSQKVIYKLCPNCGSFFEKISLNINSYNNLCPLCLSMKFEWFTVAHCYFNKSTRYISTNELLKGIKNLLITNQFNVPLEFFSFAIQKKENFFNNQFKKGNPRFPVNIPPDIRLKIASNYTCQTKVLTLGEDYNNDQYNTKNSNLSFENVSMSLERYKTKIHPRLSKSRIIWKKIIFKHNKDDVF